jgi:hypothetical protein
MGIFATPLRIQQLSATQVSTGRDAADRATERAGQWFLLSGIRERSGGVARFYRSDTGSNARVSTEITGYAVSTLSFLYTRTGEIEYLNAARRSATFLLRSAWDSGLGVFPFEHSAAGQVPERLAYFFDTGIIVRGLLALWRITGDADLLDGAVQGGESLHREFRAGAGFHPILRLPEKEPLEYGWQWSRSPGCYQLKSAMSWLELARATRSTEWTARFEGALAAALKSHRDFLPAQTPEQTMDRLHAYCYFLESLAPVYQRPEAAEAVSGGIDRTAAYLREIAPRFERSDVYAQLLRVRLMAHQGGVVALDESAAAWEAARIPEFQLDSDDIRLEGGFAFGRKLGEMLPYANPVSTAFCLQALEWWRDRQSGKHIDTGSLI